MFENSEKIRRHIGMLLRDQPPGTTADLSDYTVAYFDGHHVMGLYLSADAPGFDEEFELTDEFLDQIPEVVAAWLNQPTYTLRPELMELLKDAPPYDAGVD